MASLHIENAPKLDPLDVLAWIFCRIALVRIAEQRAQDAALAAAADLALRLPDEVEHPEVFYPEDVPRLGDTEAFWIEVAAPFTQTNRD